MTSSDYRSRVEDLCRRLHLETWCLAHHATDHPLHKELVGMGRDAVPALLHRLSTFEDDDGMAVWEPIIALAEITGEDPVPDEDAGRLLRIIEHWLEWGRRSGFQWND